jgi:hypothetical protein
MDFLGYSYSKSALLTLEAWVCDQHKPMSETSKPLGIVKKNTLELPKIAIVMQ